LKAAVRTAARGLPLSLLVLALLVGPARAQPTDPINNPTIDFDEPERKRAVSELPDPMPPIPEASALREFEAGATTPNRFGVDPESLLVRGKEIVQFTLVITSPRGVRNIGYEALDCETGQVRLMAIGRDGGGWSPVESPNWRAASGSSDTRNAHYRELFKSWCDGGGVAGTPQQLVRRLDVLPQRYRN
jgi:hypothetical protein